MAAAVKSIAIESHRNAGRVQFIAIAPPWLQQLNLSQLCPAAMLATLNLSKYTALVAAIEFIAIVSRCHVGHVEFIAITPPWLQQLN
jgi:hypothetical protein